VVRAVDFAQRNGDVSRWTVDAVNGEVLRCPSVQASTDHVEGIVALCVPFVVLHSAFKFSCFCTFCDEPRNTFTVHTVHALHGH